MVVSSVSLQVLCIIIFPLCITYSDKGGVYVTNSNKSFNITVKYPFDYNNRTVVYTDEDGPLDSFNFDPAIQVCAQLFVGVVIVTGITAVLTLLMSCAVHKNERVANKVLIAVSMQIVILLKGCQFSMVGTKRKVVIPCHTQN